MRRHFLLLLFAVLLLSEMFGWKLGVSQRVSIKNAFRYGFSAARVKQLTVQKKRLKNGSRHADSNETWFSHALDSLHHLIGSRR